MLQTMRHWAQSWVFKGLMLMLIVSFGIWGIGDIFHGNPLQRTVAKVGEASITVQQLNHEFDQDLLESRQILGQSLTAQQAKQMGFMEKALNTIIDGTLIDQQTQRLGIDIDAQALLARVAAQPQLRDKDGKFNLPLFRQLLAQEHLTEHDFIEQGRRDMARRQLIDLLASNDSPTDIVVDDLIKARGQKRFFDIISIKNSSITGIPTPDDKTLQDFWQKNSGPFTSPEYRSATIALLTADEVAKDIHISDDLVKKEFSKRSDELIKPERRDIIQVLVQDEDQAKKIVEAAKASGNLQEAAKSFNRQAVALNQVDQKTLLPELAAPVFALQNEHISAPIKSALGWHVVQIKKITIGGKLNYDEVKNDLRESLKHDEAIEEVTQTVNRLDDELAAGHPLEDIADSLKLRLVKLPPINANGKGSDDKEPSEFPEKEDVLRVIYSQNSGEISPVMEDKHSNYYVVRTDDVVPSAIKSFDKVQTAVSVAWKAFQQTQKAAVDAERIAKAIREGKTPESFSGNGIEVHSSKAVSLLGDQDSSLPASILPQIMKMKKGEAITAATADQQLVIRLSKVTEANVADNKTSRMKITSELSRDSSDEIVQQYIEYLRQVHPVKIYQDVLEELQQQGG